LFVIIILLSKEILEKKYLQYRKHNEKLDYDYYPDFPAPLGHIPEAVIIKDEQPV
jgi:hypothetical protein